MRAQFLLVAITCLGLQPLVLGGCWSALIGEIETPVLLQESNPLLPRRLYTPANKAIKKNPEIIAIEEKTKMHFLDLIGWPAINPVGPQVGIARALATSVLDSLVYLKTLSTFEKKVIWEQSRVVLKSINPDWEMREIKTTSEGTYVFQGHVPDLPETGDGAATYPVLVFDKNGDIYSGRSPSFDSDADVEALKLKLKKRKSSLEGLVPVLSGNPIEDLRSYRETQRR